MTPLPAALGGGTELVAWRLDMKEHAGTWDSGEGAFRKGARWNNKGLRAVYCSLDPATAVIEVAVHKGFETLDTVPHVLSAVNILEPDNVYVVHPRKSPNPIPNPNWLRPGIESAGQRNFGDDLLKRHKFIVIPSVVSTHSWNLIFVGSNAVGAYRLGSQEDFALDTRLHAPLP